MKYFGKGEEFWTSMSVEMSVEIGEVGIGHHWQISSSEEEGNLIEFYEDGVCKRAIGLPYEPELLTAIGRTICDLRGREQ